MQTMNAICVHHVGGPDVLQWEQVPRPEPAEDELLVQVRAASVNPVDYKLRSGAVSLSKQHLPMGLGRDVSGVIASCGPQVRGTKEGDEIYAMLPWDHYGYAEYVAIKAYSEIPIGMSSPKTISTTLVS